MNARERFITLMSFERVDRPLFWESGYWLQAIESWSKQGLPVDDRLSLIESHARLSQSNTVGGETDFKEDVSIETLRKQGSLRSSRPSDIFIHSYFGFDEGFRKVPLNSWFSPPFEVKVLEEGKETVIVRDEWGITKKIRKDGSSVPQFMDWPIKNRRDFEKVKEERFVPVIERRLLVNWNELEKKYKTHDYPLAIGGGPFGFFGSIRYLMGGVNLFVSYYDNPNLVKDILNFLTDFWISLWSEVIPHIKADCAMFWEDMAYNKGSLISPKIFKEFMTPCYKKITEFLKSQGVNIILVDTDGDCRELIPLFMEAGVTGLLPFEVQAGMNIIQVRKEYPNLQIIGGLDKRAIARGKEEIDKELEEKLPPMLKHGGYIPTADHYIPPDVPWENFKYYRKRIKEISSSMRS